MKRVVISVEGKTELLFVKKVLYPYLYDKGIFVTPVSINGYKTYSYIRSEIFKLGKGKKCIITTMYDYYGLSKINDFAGINFDNIKTKNCIEKINNIEFSFKNDIGLNNFIPYIQLHEFETFMFIDSDITAKNLSAPDITESINKALKDFDNNPEFINSEAFPSKRIIDVCQNYDKTIDGPKICEDLGIPKIMNSCPHFKEWIEKIENFGE